MKDDFNDLYEGPRFQNRARKRKKKFIFSSISIVVVLVFVIVGMKIFSNEDAPAEVAMDHQPVENNSDTTNGSQSSNVMNEEQKNLALPAQEENDNDFPLEEEEERGDEQEQSSSDDVRLEESSDPLVLGTIQKNWEPVGTEQQGEHVTTFTEGTQDWNEMIQAVSVATGLSADDMIIWWLGNGGAPDKAVSTVSTKDQETFYRVYMEWIDDRGWKPLVVEQLKQNDRKVETEETMN